MKDWLREMIIYYLILTNVYEISSTIVPLLHGYPFSYEKWSYVKGDLSWWVSLLVLFYCLYAFEIWPDKRVGLWWEWPDKRVGLWWEWPYKRVGLWWEWPYKKGNTVILWNFCKNLVYWYIWYVFYIKKNLDKRKG